MSTPEGTGRPILGIPGSVAAGAFNVRLLEIAGRICAPAGTVVPVPQQEVAALPAYDPRATAFPPSVQRLRTAVDGCRGLLVSTPEYNGSIPGALKNAIDWAAAGEDGGPIRGKAAAVIGVDRGPVGADWAHAEVRKVLDLAGARVIPDELVICDADRPALWNGEGLADTDAELALRQVLDSLLMEAAVP